LAAVAIDGERAARQRLNDEVGDDPAIIGMHARAIDIEDARDEGRVSDRAGDRPKPEKASACMMPV
jgi:hypothetical protein